MDGVPRTEWERHGVPSKSQHNGVTLDSWKRLLFTKTNRLTTLGGNIVPRKPLVGTPCVDKSVKQARFFGYVSRNLKDKRTGGQNEESTVIGTRFDDT